MSLTHLLISIYQLVSEFQNSNGRDIKFNVIHAQNKISFDGGNLCETNQMSARCEK